MIINKRALRVAALVAALLVTATRAFAAEVVIKPNGSNKSASNIFIRGGRKQVKFATIADVYREHYHAAEYHNGHLYVIRRLGGESPVWRDELWRYDRGGKGTKLWSERGLDFRVRDDEGMIAVLSPHGEDPYRNDLHIIDSNGKLLKSYQPKQLARDMAIDQWDGRFVWMAVLNEPLVCGFIKIDTRSWEVKKYDTGPEFTDYDLDVRSLRLAYSDYPMMFDIESHADFVKAKTPVKLYVRDLGTGRKRLIARSIAKEFKPKWIDAATLEYENPKGKGRIRAHVPPL